MGIIINILMYGLGGIVTGVIFFLIIYYIIWFIINIKEQIEKSN